MAVQIPSYLYPRGIEKRVLRALEHSPVVLIHGPRQSGKTTLARFIGGLGGASVNGRSTEDTISRGRSDYEYYNLDLPALRSGARDDPVRFVSELPQKVILDEVQHVPEIFDAIKISVDRNRVSGRFLITGSANLSLIPQLANSLVGRMRIMRLYSFAQRELEGKLTETRGNFVRSAFEGEFKMDAVPTLGKDLAERVCVGGYIPAIRLPTASERNEWYLDYVESLVERDLIRLTKIRSPEIMKDLLQVAASHTGQLFNLESLSAPFELSRPTIEDYVYLLERVFLIQRIPAWHNNRMSRLIKKPKLHLMDTGIGSALLDTNTETLLKDRAMFGHLLESFVLQELRKQADWGDVRTGFYHFRHKDDYEVDIVMERHRNTIVGVEVKASSTVGTSDFRGLRKLEKIAGQRFVQGLVLYDGEHSVPFGKNMWAIPIRFLWEM